MIQVGSLVELSPLTKAGFNDLRLPVFWLIPSWKILLSDSSIKYKALFDLATVKKDGVVQPVPQSKGDALLTWIPLTVVREPRTSIGSPVVVVISEDRNVVR